MGFSLGKVTENISHNLATGFLSRDVFLPKSLLIFSQNPSFPNTYPNNNDMYVFGKLGLHNMLYIIHYYVIKLNIIYYYI